MSEMSEIELLQAFRERRSEEAFADLVRRYAGLVYSVAKRRLANAALAEDITQMVFIRLAKTPPPLKTPAELAAWLHRTTVHVTIDAWRSETRRRAREEKAVTMDTAASEPAAWENVAPKLDEALDQLNEEDRRALLLRFFSQKTMREVGTALGVSEDAAKMRVSRAVDRLRTQMGVGSVACTTTVLGAMLVERSVEAAPIQLLERLAAIKVPALAGTTGLVGVLIRLASHKLTASATALAIIAAAAFYFTRQANPPPTTTMAESNAPTTGPQSTESAKRTRVDSFPNANSALAATSPPKAVKAWFHVLDADTGQGLPNTKIHVAYFGAGGIGEGHDLLTDDKGIVGIPEPDSSAIRSGPNVFVTAENHVPKVVGFGRTPMPADYTIKLEPAAIASGVVIDEQGLPVADVKITVRGGGNIPGQIENVDFQMCSGTSTNDGTWRCSFLPRQSTGERGLVLHKPGYVTTLIDITEARSDLNHLVLVIDHGFAITGRVTDAQNNPISAARLKTLGGDDAQRQSTRTDDNGYFTLAGVAGLPEDGLYQGSLFQTNRAGDRVLRGLAAKGPLHTELAIQADGFAPMIRRVDLSEITNNTNFTLPAGNLFRGRVVDENGNPIARAVVKTDYDFEHQVERQFDWSTRTDDDGYFQWDGAPTQEVCYWFEADGYKAIRGQPLHADGSEHEIVLKH